MEFLEVVRSLLREGKPKLAIDIDGTVADSPTATLQEYNRRLVAQGRQPYETVLDVWYHPRFDNCSPTSQSWYKEVGPSYNHVWINRHEEIRFMGGPDFHQTITGLRQYFDLEFLTLKKDSVTEPGVKSWLKLHSLDHIPLTILTDYSIRGKLGHKAYIDDNPKFESSVTSDQLLLLVGHLYGQKVQQRRNVHVLDNVDQATKLLLEVSRQVAPRRKPTFKPTPAHQRIRNVA